jgi:hypothetical protein
MNKECFLSVSLPSQAISMVSGNAGRLRDRFPQIVEGVPPIVSDEATQAQKVPTP